MAPKRKAEEFASPKSKKGKTQRDEAPLLLVEVVESNCKSKKKPTTLKEKILHLLANEDKFVGLPTIKKILKEQYDIEDSKTNITRINKALKELADEQNPNFGKVHNSYHGGESSAAYREYATEQEAKLKLEQEIAEHEDDYKCPFCDAWNDSIETCLGEDSIARGGKYRCGQCGKIFYTWIGDCHYNKVGHKVEYKKSGMYF